ncbi:GLPGLI family protein [Elizabethkingia anophelis]|nr:GLPGLI family protein [Elizabethkingia anophelis]
MKNLFVLLLSLCTSIYCSAQLTFPQGFSYPSSKYKAENLDDSNQNFYYQLSFVRDKKNPQRKLVTLFILQLGEKFSKFTEFNALKMDSLQEKYSHQSTVGSKEINEMLNFRSKISIVLIKDIAKGTYVFQDRVKNTYQYEEKQPSFNWKLEKGTKDILGHKCNKASTEYKGRKYTAWYATDIPINNGPYVFQGLPGFILELEDEDKEYHFIAVAIDKNSKPIYIRTESDILKVSREQFKKVEKSYYDNPGFFTNGAYNEDGSEIKVKSKPYNPIELE